MGLLPQDRDGHQDQADTVARPSGPGSYLAGNGGRLSLTGDDLCRSSAVSSLFVESRGPSHDHDYLAREAKARVEIDKQLAAAGWKVQSRKALNLGAGPGVAVREFILEKPHGRVDYLLFVNGQPAGVIEAKPEGTTLTEVEHQSGKYV